MSSNNSNHIFPTAIRVNNETNTNPSDIANAFYNYFAKVAIDIQSSIRFSKKKYYDYILPLNIESFFLTPTDITEISNIIFSNSYLLLAIVFNQSFSSGIFPSILKTRKII